MSPAVALTLAVALAACDGGPGGAAGWKELGATKSSTVYIDASSIQRAGQTVRMKYLVNHDKMSVVPRLKHRYVSVIILAEYDCIGRKEMGLHITEYSGGMATGEVLLSVESKLGWNSIVPNSVGEKLWKAACTAK